MAIFFTVVSCNAKEFILGTIASVVVIIWHDWVYSADFGLIRLTLRHEMMYELRIFRIKNLKLV